MWKIRIILLFFFCVKLGLGAQTQDLHFSQFYNSPLSINPSNTGFIPDADYRIGVNYRNQWYSILSSPYKTFSVFGDAQVFRDRLENGWLGLGGLILRDESGSGSLQSTKIYGSLAYHQMLGQSSLLTGGFNLGWVNKRIDVSKLKFPDQFDGVFFDNTLPTNAVLNTNNISYFDIQVGMNYAYFPTENVYINGGYSIQHVNTPKESFFSNTDNDSKISMRHIGFINASLKVNDKVILNPNVFYTNQASSSELVLGINGNYNLEGAGDKQLILGAYYRYSESIIPTVGLVINNIKFTFSYDATVSTLQQFDYLRGASELSIIKNGFYNDNSIQSKQVLCPKF